MPANTQRNRNEKTSARVGSIAGKWQRRLRIKPRQKRFNISREDLGAMTGSTQTQRPNRKPR